MHVLLSRGVLPYSRSPDLQEIVRNPFKTGKSCKTSLNDLILKIFESNNSSASNFTLTGKMKLINFIHRYLSSFSWSFYDFMSFIAFIKTILQNSS